MIVDVTESLTVVTTRSAATPPAGGSGGSAHSGSRWAELPAVAEPADGQLLALEEPVGVSYLRSMPP